MQRDMELVRLILLAIEADHRFDGRNQFSVPLEFGGYTSQQIAYHCRMLVDGGMISGEIRHGPRLSCSGLTQQGHDLVDAIRNPQIWQKTKDAAAAAGGWTVGLLKDCATAYVKAKLKEATGLDI